MPLIVVGRTYAWPLVVGGRGWLRERTPWILEFWCKKGRIVDFFRASHAKGEHVRRTFTNFKSLPALAAIILLVVTATANPQARKKLGEGRPGIQNIPAGWDPKAPCCRCKGGIEFPQAYTPQPGDKEALRGRAYILKDKARGKVIGRAVTDEGGNFEFPSPLGETADNYTNTARLVCNGDGNCWDFQPLPMDPGPVLEPILS